jgi:cyclic nucleotide gated channel beta 1
LFVFKHNISVLGCDEAFLRELVLKLRSVIFLPNDFVCRKGEVGKEMYIIKTGQLQVLGGKNNDVLATLITGHWFGEISLLDIGAQGNRRTADVRSKGFSNLFVLSKSDLQEVIVHYDDARAALESRAKVILKENATRDKKDGSAVSQSKRSSRGEVVIGLDTKTPNQQPKLLDAVIQALPMNSPAVHLLTRGSKRRRKRAPANFKIENEFCKEEICENYGNLTDNEKELLKSARESLTNVKCDVHREMS